MKSSNIMLTKSMVQTIIAIINGSNCLESLQKELKASKSWMARIVGSLDTQEFVKKVRRGKSLKIRIATTPYAIAFKDMYLNKPYRKYSEIFSGRNLDVLQAIVSGEKSTKILGNMLKVQSRIIRPRLRFLASKGLILKKGKRYIVSRKQTDVIMFLTSLRNFSNKNGIVLWKFGNAAIIKTNKLSDVKGVLTGFNKYTEFGVKINTINYIYYTGTEKLSVEDFFVHSLFEVDDKRTFALAMTLYAKQNLYMKRKIQKISQLAEKFDKLNEFENMSKVFEMIRIGKIQDVSKSPIIDIKEIQRQFNLYEVKNV